MKNFTCAWPHPENAINLSHGGGGRNSRKLLKDLIYKYLNNEFLAQQHDASAIDWNDKHVVMSTDSFVVDPIFFKGGDIGRLSVIGTCNDLAMAGAQAHWLSLGLIVEEGFLIDSLEKILQSIALACQECNVQIITGDTKVVNRGKGDGVYINTTGIGALHPRIQGTLRPQPNQICNGATVYVNGDIGRHGISLMLQRQNLNFNSSLHSDLNPLWPQIRELLDHGFVLQALRDCTRGGLAAALYELADSSQHTIYLEESKVPISIPVANACEVLGLDPLFVACEGRYVLISSDPRLENHPNLIAIGRVGPRTPHPLLLRSQYGTERIIELPEGELLPRIC